MLFLNNYEYFLKIVETKSITKAAESLYISQPSLSKYLKRLEDAIGAQLFLRDSYPLKLTHVGEEYLNYVNSIVSMNTSFKREISDYLSGISGTIRIGIAYWRATFMLPYVLPDFSRNYPNIRISINEGSFAVLSEQLIDGQNDLMFYNDTHTAIPNTIHNEPIFREPLLFAMHRNDPIARKYDISFSGHMSLSEIPIIPPEEINGHKLISAKDGQSLYRQVIDFISHYNLDTEIIFKTENLTTALGLVSNEMGSTFVPGAGVFSIKPYDDVVYARVSVPELEWNFNLAYRKNTYLSDAAKRFIAHVRSKYDGFFDI